MNDAEWIDGFKLMNVGELDLVYQHGRCNLGLPEDHPKIQAILKLIAKKNKKSKRK